MSHLINIAKESNLKEQAVRDQIQAIFNTGQKPETKAFMDYIYCCLMTCREKGDWLTGDEQKWNQGACQVLKELYELPVRAGKILRSK